MSRFDRRSNNYEPPKSKIGSIVFLTGTLVAFLILFPPWESKQERSDRITAKVMEKVKQAEPDTFRKIERQKLFGDTKLQITAIVKDINAFDNALNKSFDDATAILSNLDTKNEKGVVFAINKMAGKEPVTLKADEYSLFQVLKDYALKCENFDITLLPYYKLWKFEGLRQHIADKKELEKVGSLVGSQKLELNKDNQTAFLTDVQMGLDLRLLYNAFVLNTVKSGLDKAGVENYFLMTGSDTVSKGKNFDNEWKLSLQHPVKTLYRFGVVVSSDAAIAINNEYSNAFEHKGKWYNQFLNPKTGQPANTNYTIVVVGKDPLAAKIIAISAFDMEAEEAIRHIESWEGYEGLVMDKKGKLHLTEKMNELVSLKEEKLY